MRFVGVFGLVIGVFYAFYLPLTSGEPAGVFGSYLAVVAEVCGAVLRLFGQDASVTGRSILSSAFSIEIVRGCDGLEATALFAAAVIASPTAWRSRLLFLLIGTAVLAAINVFRTVSLFLVGAHFPKAFDRIHFEAWPGVLIVLIFVCWLIWARWAVRKESLPADVSD